MNFGQQLGEAAKATGAALGNSAIGLYQGAKDFFGFQNGGMGPRFQNADPIIVPSVTALDETVVTAYGNQGDMGRGNNTGSQTQNFSRKDLRKMNRNNAAQAMMAGDELSIEELAAMYGPRKASRIIAARAGATNVNQNISGVSSSEANVGDVTSVSDASVGDVSSQSYSGGNTMDNSGANIGSGTIDNSASSTNINTTKYQGGRSLMTPGDYAGGRATISIFDDPDRLAQLDSNQRAAMYNAVRAGSANTGQLIGGLQNGGRMTPNLGGYPDIPYLFGYQIGGMVPSYQDSEVSVTEDQQLILDNPKISPRDRYRLSNRDYQMITNPYDANTYVEGSFVENKDDYVPGETYVLKNPVDTITFGPTIGTFITMYSPGDTVPTLVPQEEALFATGEINRIPSEEVINDPDVSEVPTPGEPNVSDPQGLLAKYLINDEGDLRFAGGYSPERGNAADQYKSLIPIEKGGYLGGIDGYENPGYTFANVGLDIRDFQIGPFADRSADSNRALRRRLREHLAAGKSPETFSVQVRTIETPEIRSTVLPTVEMPTTPMEKVSGVESPDATKGFNLADVMSEKQYLKMEELEEKLFSGEKLTKPQKKRLANLQSLYHTGKKGNVPVSSIDELAASASAAEQSSAAERASAAGKAAASAASGPTKPSTGSTTGNRRTNRLEKLEGKLQRVQQRTADRQARKSLRDNQRQQIQDLRGQIRAARGNAMDGMKYFPPTVGGNIPNGGQIAPAFNFAQDGILTGMRPNMMAPPSYQKGGIMNVQPMPFNPIPQDMGTLGGGTAPMLQDGILTGMRPNMMAPPSYQNGRMMRGIAPSNEYYQLERLGIAPANSNLRPTPLGGALMRDPRARGLQYAIPQNQDGRKFMPFPNDRTGLPVPPSARDMMRPIPKRNIKRLR